ncbi:MAG: hypothetical protein RIR62_3035 [Pseudomonadota bacterium]|jgi:LacI family transcriptional regulator
MPPDSTPPKARRPVTLKRIAEELGLSVTTVARSLKDGHKIGPATVQRVRETAQALGYVPNLDGLRLRTGRSYTILAQIGLGDEDGDPAPIGLMGGLQRRLAQTEYALRSLPSAAASVGLGALSSALRANSADGFVIDRLTRDDPRLALLSDRGAAFVTLGPCTERPTQAGLFLDEADAAARLAAGLLAEGRRRIALLDDDPRVLDAAARRQGLSAALSAAGADPPALPPQDAHALVTAIRQGRIDALFCGSDAHLAQAVQMLARAGIGLDDLGLAVRSATRLPALMPAPIHVAWFAAELAGMILADLLLRRIDGTPPAALQVTERLQLRLRG